MPKHEIETARAIVRSNENIADTAFIKGIVKSRERSVGVSTRDVDSSLSAFKAIFKDSDPTALNKWMTEVDHRVQKSTLENLRSIDKAAEAGDFVKKDLVIVGGGPLTSLAVSILSPHYEITLITEQESIGKPWRDRPIFLNSAIEEDKQGKRLPLLSGSMTPITEREATNSVSADVLLDEYSMAVSCTDGMTRKYASGQEFGKVIATNIALNVSDFIAGQRVEFDRTNIESDVTKVLEIVDKNTGAKRQLKANTLLVLTGPGKEHVQSDEYRQEYTRANEALDRSIKAAKEQVADNQEEVALDIPQILSLTSLEKIYEFWQDYLGKDPESYPLAQVLSSHAKSIGIIGDGDAAKALVEFVSGKGPKEAYPDGLRPTVREITVYSPKKYPEEEWNRKPNFSELTAHKVIDAGSDFFWNTAERKMVTDLQPKETGHKNPLQEHDYVFMATGIKREAIDEKLPVAIGKVEDIEGNVVGLGNEEKGIYIGGSATRFTAKDFPDNLKNIIKELDIPQNIISLWAHGLLVERMCWSLVAKKT